MATEEHAAILNEGVRVWNEWRSAHPNVRLDVSGQDFGTVRLNRVNLRGADLSRTRFSNLSGSNLDGTILRHANLAGADLAGARLHGADLFGCDLTGAILESAQLVSANLEGATLSRADCTNADFTGAQLRNANLSHARLTHASLNCALIVQAEINDADLRGADLTRAIFSRSRLERADLTDAMARQTVFAGMDLSEASLTGIKHLGPSTIGIDTLYLSHGQISGSFLRGAGVPEAWIKLSLDAAVHGMGSDSCFISYQSRDIAFAERLRTDLQNSGVRCWYAPEHMHAGEIRGQIAEAIREYRRVIVILSEHSARSEWIKYEIALARQKEVEENCTVLVPVSLVAMSRVSRWKRPGGLMGRAECFIRDFSNWEDPEAYRKAFSRLLAEFAAPGCGTVAARGASGSLHPRVLRFAPSDGRNAGPRPHSRARLR
jgi:uncharacterized protein YjbI with pentapeptide repeats